MSLYTLRLMAESSRREEAAIDAAVDSFRAKDLPPIAQMHVVKAPELSGGKLTVEAKWPRSSDSAKYIIDTKARTGEVIAQRWVVYTMAGDKAAIDKKTIKAVLTVVNEKIDAGYIAASRDVRAAIAVALKR